MIVADVIEENAAEEILQKVLHAGSYKYNKCDITQNNEIDSKSDSVGPMNSLLAMIWGTL